MRTIAEFAAQRRTDQDEMEKSLFPYVSRAIDAYPVEGWYNDLLEQVGLLYVDVFHDEGGKGQPKPTAAEFVADVRTTLDKTEDPTDATVDRISVWLATAILNAGTQAAAATDEEFLVMEWVTMHDEDVRDAHRAVEGQQRPPGVPFDVSGFEMAYPGDPTAPIELWINCRCTLAPVLGSEAASHQVTNPSGVVMTATETETEEVVNTPVLTWHGVLAPEGVMSGDKRMFANGSLTWRDLPVPLTWQKISDDGHKGSVVVGRIDSIDRVGTMMHGSGVFLQTPESDEAVGLVAEFGRFGVSVDADEAEMELNEETGEATFSSARIASASMVPIPAFQEAYISLGDWPDAAQEEEPTSESIAQSDTTEVFVSDKPWSGFTQADYTPAQWKSACCLHRSQELEPKSNHGLPIKEPGGALNRNGVHAAAARFNQVSAPAAAKGAAKSCLRGAYSSIGEEPPDVLKASAELGRGPGWITDPVATKRIHDYWTKPGQEGYAKIGWGTGGDFARCKTQVGEEIAENSPDKVRFLNQICAQWHHDALGIWPGEHLSAEKDAFRQGYYHDAVPAPAVTLVASSGHHIPAAWVADPKFDKPTPLTITDEGRVFGHMAQWGTCHVGFDGVCIEPPRSESGYAYFLTGEIETDEGHSVPVGNITIDGPHAPTRFRARPAMAHYDNTCSVVADVNCGEDEFGIWVAGWIRPGTTEEKVYALRACGGLSGDWREIKGRMEMIAALAVNSGGFPVPRVGVSGGTQISLVAAGTLTSKPDQVTNPEFSIERFAEAVVVAMKKVEADTAKRAERMKALAVRIGGHDGV